MRRTVVCLLVFCLLVVFLVSTVVNMEQVWATVTFNPNPPEDGQPFMITSSGGPSTPLSLYGSCGCNGGCSISAGASPYTVTLAAGQYNVFDSGDSSCTSFTVVPAVTTTTSTASPIPEYPYGLPLLAILLVIGYRLVRRRINY